MSPAQQAPLRVWPHVATFLGWGMVLSFLQWGAERSVALLGLTEWLARVLGYGLGTLVHVPTHVEGTVVKLYGWSQEITPNCFGLAAVTFLLAALLATPASARERLRGAGLGLLAILLANVVRLVVLSWFFAYAFFAFGFVHIPIWGTVVPLFLVAVWGLWLVRDLHAAPRFPLKLLGFVVALLGPLLAVWYLVLDGYVVSLVVGINTILTTLGVPIETVRLASAELFRYVDVEMPTRGFRIEVAAQTLNLVPCVALILASPLPLTRRVRATVYAIGALVGLHAASTAGLIVLGWMAPPLVAPFQIVNDFFSLAAGPSLWLLLARPSRAWFATAGVETPLRLTRVMAEARQAGRRARSAR